MSETEERKKLHEELIERELDGLLQLVKDLVNGTPSLEKVEKEEGQA